MDAHRWKKISDLFLEALERPLEERGGFLDTATGGDSELAREVWAMLREDESAATGRGGALEVGAVEAPTAALSLGDTEVAGYRLIRALGAGGMGTVWEAEQAQPHRRVAFKTLRSAGVGGAKAGARLEREAALLGRLNHPSIAQVFEAGVAELDGFELPWLSMELVEGARSLFDYAREEGLSAEARVRLMVEAARAVHHGHERGIVHRDLKAGNVLVSDAGVLKVIDFGIAAQLDGAAFEERLTHTGDLLGTLRSMAPEQFQGGAPVDARTDVFALGCLLYEVLCGAMPHPVEGLGFSEAVQRIERDPARRPVEAVAALGPEIEWILARALAKRPDERYASAAALADDLERLLAREAVSVGPPTTRYRVRSFVRRYRGAVAAVAAVFLALTLGLVGAGAALAKAGTALDSAEAERTRFSQLAILAQIEDLQSRAEHLWPPHPERIGALEEWNAEALQLTARLPELEAELTRLEHTDEPGERARAPALRKVRDQLAALADPLRGLAGPNAAAGSGWSIPRRLTHARWLAQLFAPGGAAAESWAAASAEIAADPRYEGLRIAPQMDLWPLGADPASGLQEFAWLSSGEVPEVAPTGQLSLHAGSAAVLVLIPGGDYALGTQSQDPTSPHYDDLGGYISEPVHVFQLSPYLIGKHELAQEQWLRLTGAAPSHFSPEIIREGPLHPVENLDWFTARTGLTRFGFDLPSEAQWEAAARGGTGTRFWTGETQETAVGALNIADLATVRQGAHFPDVNYWPEFDDRYPVHAPVHTLRANPFGLHHVIGNVSEWCLDFLAPYSQLPSATDPVQTRPGLHRVVRGASFSRGAHNGKSGMRSSFDPSVKQPNVGLRVARPVQVP